MLQGTCPDHIAITYGLTRNSILNTSRYFHVTEGLPPDCMHDMLEGSIQYEVKELLKSLINEGLVDINSRIERFPYSSRDAVNKPSPIDVSSANYSLNQSGKG